MSTAKGVYFCSKNAGTMQAKGKCTYYDGTNYPVNVAIITATDIEYDAVRKYLLPEGIEAWSRYPSQGDISWCRAEYQPTSENGEHLIRLVMAQARRQGLPAAAVQAAKSCHLFHPNFLVMLGITAGRKGFTNLGDVIIPTSVFDYGAGKWKDNSFQPAPHQLDTDEIIDRQCEIIARDLRPELDRIASEYPLQIPGNTRIEVRRGHAVSGAAVIDSKAIWSRILKTDKEVIAIDMEAYAVAFAGREAPEPKPKVLISKAVCDFGLKKTDGAQTYAAYTSARFFRLYMDRYYEMF